MILLVILIGYLSWGPLFPWNPVKPGFTEIESEKAVIYVQDYAEKDSVLHQIQTIIQEEEEFHDLEYRDDFRIIVLSDDNSMKRYLPWMKGSGFSVSLSLVDVIYIGPAARNSLKGIEPHLKHELSHLLIDQNTTFKKALKIHDQGWLAEGLAEYFSDHQFYTETEFLKLCRMYEFSFTKLHEQNPLSMSISQVRLNYTFYKFFIEFLVENYGIEKFQKYLKEYLNDPDNYKELFISVYSQSLDEILDKFRSHFNM